MTFELGFQFGSSDFSQLNLSFTKGHGEVLNFQPTCPLVKKVPFGEKNDVMKFLVRLSVIQLKHRVFECSCCSTTTNPETITALQPTNTYPTKPIISISWLQIAANGEPSPAVDVSLLPVHSRWMPGCQMPSEVMQKLNSLAPSIL